MLGLCNPPRYNSLRGVHFDFANTDIDGPISSYSDKRMFEFALDIVFKTQRTLEVVCRGEMDQDYLARALADIGQREMLIWLASSKAHMRDKVCKVPVGAMLVYRSGDVLWVEMLCSAGFRAGVGVELMRRAIEYASANRYRNLMLNSVEGQVSYYRDKLGFRDTGRRLDNRPADRAGDGKEYTPLTEMVLNL